MIGQIIKWDICLNMIRNHLELLFGIMEQDMIDQDTVALM